MNLMKIMAITTLATLMSSCGNANKVSGNKLSPEIPPYPIPGGVSAPFAGFVGDRLIVAGGCNFPDIPAAEGGTKSYYGKVFSFSLAAGEWEEQPPIARQTAYGTAVETPYGLVCAGGQDSSSPLADAFIICLDGQSISVHPLPGLPVAIDNGGGACAGDRVIVTGGNQSDGGKGVYSLSMSDPQQWERLCEYPGPKRVQPVVMSDGEALYIAGGFQLNAETKECLLSTDIIRYDIASRQWTEVAKLPADRSGEPRCLVGGSGTCVNGCLIMTGGVNYGIFRDAVEGRGPSDYMKKPREWYQFNKDILIYDLQANQWETIPDVAGMDKAGGILLHRDGILYMVCGELKPGIRTEEIARFSLK